MSELDNEAMRFMENRRGNQAVLLDYPSIQSGGKRHTKIARSVRQSKNSDYISDEPERFIEYIESRKDEFTTEEKGKQIIEEMFKSDNSLANLLNGLENRGVKDRELNAIINTKQVQGWLGYKKIARNLHIKTKTFKRYLRFIDSNKLEKENNNISKNKRYKIDINKLFYTERAGIFKNKQVVGKLTIIKRNSKNIISYKDAKGRFIKVQ
jgi:hypothetical protein